MEDPTVEEDYCVLFDFVLKLVLTGGLCLLGFGANTASFVTLWREKPLSSATLLIQAILIADFAVIWMVFVGEALPSLGYVIPILQDCTMVCHYVKLVTRPMLFLSHFCVVWFTLLLAINHYFIVCKPLSAPASFSVDFVRKEVIITVICGVLFTTPMTFDSTLTLPGGEDPETLIDNHWYRLLYIHLSTVLLVYAIPFVCLIWLILRLWLALSSLRRLSAATSHRAQHIDMIQVSLTLAVAIIICYLPLAVYQALAWRETENHQKNSVSCGQLLYYLTSFSSLFLAINSSIKLVILALFSRDFKKRLCSSVGCCCWSCCCCRKELTKEQKAVHFEENVLDNIYKCGDMSEMTLISHAADNTRT